MEVTIIGREYAYKPNQYEQKGQKMLSEYFSYSKFAFKPYENSSELNYEMTTVESEENLIGFHVGDYFKNTFQWLQQVKVDRVDYQNIEGVAF